MRSVRFFFQRRFRGWDDSDTWALDTTISKLILPRLKRFKLLKVGCPSHVESMEEWNAMLMKMIHAFEFLASDEKYGNFDQVKNNEVNEGLDMFCQNFRSLWW